MPRKADPVLAVMRFFEGAPLPAAEQALTLAKEVIKARQREEGSLSPRGQAVSAKHKKQPGPAKSRAMEPASVREPALTGVE
jgi:hypothetical protein